MEEKTKQLRKIIEDSEELVSNQLEFLESVKKDIKSSVSRELSELEETKSKILNKNVELLKLNEDINSLKVRVPELQNRIKYLSTEIETKEKNNAALEDSSEELKEIETKRKLLLEENKSLVDSSEKLKGDIENNNEELTKVVCQAESTRKDKRDLLSEISTLNKELVRQKKDTEYSKSMFKGAEADLRSIKATYHNMADRSRAKERGVERLESKLLELEENKNGKEMELSGMDDKFNKSLERLKQIEEECNLERAKLKDSENRVIALKKEVLKTILDNKDLLNSKQITKFTGELK